jgi:CRISPR/Cas system-associated exonuclease Cas4 (RecB family)
MSDTLTTDIKPFTWSYSVLKNYETCPRRYYAYNVARDVTEPESDAIRQGHAVHEAFEARVKSGQELPLGMGMHEPMLAKLASAPGKVYAEQKLGLTAEFKPTTFFGKGVWFRIVLDYTNVRPDYTATVIDYKTGRPMEDLTQLQLSAATLFAHEPKLTRVKAALVFTAHERVETAEFVRSDVTEIWGDILPRVNKVVQARQRDHYPPKPGGLCRRWCAVASCPFHGK